ncbi:MAG: PEP/pyruvate-binding domain-containing protein [Jatrophihabitantaceae bacterium]
MTTTYLDPAAGRAATPTNLVVPLGRGRRVPAARLGGKGARLDQLLRAGAPVPPAFCLTIELFDLFLDRTGLRREIIGASPATVREMIRARKIPADLAEVVLGAYHQLDGEVVAVRSSAAAEDAADQSFAGQHDTVLGVSGDAQLLEAVRTCWASLWSERAMAYRAPDAEPGRMAVVVQRLVEAEVSGVLFTVDPVSGRPNRMVVEACHGLGEGLVSGRVSSDSFVIDDRTLAVIEENIRYKVTQCTTLEPGRVGLTKVDARTRNAPCLTRDQLRGLSELALKVRGNFGAEQDIEWAMADGVLWLLQSRPITTTAIDSSPRSPYVETQHDSVMRGTLWSRMDIGEIFVGRMSPLGLSFARYHQMNVHSGCAAAVGVRDTGDPVGYMGYLHGHVYLNVSYTAYLLSQCLPTRDQSHFTTRFVSEEVDLSTYRNPFGSQPGGTDDLKAGLHWARVTVRELLRMKGKAAEMSRSRLREFDRARGLDLSKLSRADLHAELERYLAHYYDMHVGYMPFYINAFSAYGVLVELCASWLGNAGSNLQNRIKTDMSSLRTVASAREVWELTRAAQAAPAVLQIIQQRPLDAIVQALQEHPDGRRYWNRHMAPFLRANGVRGHQEMELTNPRWVDDPSYLFQMIRRYADEGFAIDAVVGRGRSEDELDTSELLAGLPLHRRRILQTVLNLYTTCSELREVARMAMITSLWTMRRLIYSLGERLVAEGALQSVDEVAYLDFAQIRQYLASDEDSRLAFPRGAIEQARLQHEYQNRLPEPPLSFIGEYDPTAAPAKPASTHSEAVSGVPASPGRVTGRARIIEDLAWQADEFQTGEILVTRYTDASWTPLFAIAGAVVTDIGSMLSHSSIVSREFKVPSVVNTKNATQRINTGDIITVDGNTGVVQIVSQDGASPNDSTAEKEISA